MELSIDFFLTFVKLRKMVWQAIPGCLPFFINKNRNPLMSSGFMMSSISLRLF